jgi:hypothetical protein
MAWITDYGKAVWDFWWVVLVALAVAAIGAAATEAAFHWPWYLWISVALLGLAVAQTLVYRKLVPSVEATLAGMGGPKESELAGLSQGELVNLAIGSAQGRVPNAGAGPEVESNRRLAIAINALSRSTDRAARWSIFFGIVIALLTLALVGLTIVLILRPASSH